MSVRRRRLSSVCAALPRFGARHVLSSAVDAAKLFVMPYRQLVWCPVYKAASTNWMLNIPLLSNFRPEELQALRQAMGQPNEVARFIAKPMNREAFLRFYRGHRNRPVSFLIVRHPLERLLSAYRDKLESADRNEHYHTTYGRRIVRDFRKQGLKRFGLEFYLRHKDRRQSRLY